MRAPRLLVFAGLLMIPLQAAMAQSGSSGGAGASPSAGGANPGVVGDSLNRSNPNPQLNQGGSGTSAQPAVPVPGTNSAGTAQPSGASAGGAANGNNSVTTGAAGGRSGGVAAQGPNKTGDPIRSEDANVDKKIKSICKGC